MKIKNYVLLIVMTALGGILIVFSPYAKNGALEGLALAQNTVIPSLLPLLIIFSFIMKSPCCDVLSKALGVISQKLFRLPRITFPAVLFGLIGGYPTGALMTHQLLESDNIDKKQARCLLRFNMCGGCGFIITAVGSAVYGSTKTGVILFFSNVLSALTVGICHSFKNRKEQDCFYSYNESVSLGDALNSATSSSVNAVLNITAYIVLFSALNGVFHIPQRLLPLMEITNGVCTGDKIPIPILCALLSFGGVCIHLQLLPVILKAGMSYFDFLLFRVINAVLSFCYAKLLVLIFPVEEYVFSNTSSTVAQFYSVNVLLSVLMIGGCFVLIGDLRSKIIASR